MLKAVSKAERFLSRIMSALMDSLLKLQLLGMFGMRRGVALSALCLVVITMQYIMPFTPTLLKLVQPMHAVGMITRFN
jgi:hypothetical protein